MSERPKQPYADMMHCAELLAARLRPACERIEIAGSLRRKKPQCSDIELVAIPKMIPNLLGEPSDYTELDALLDGLPVNFTKRGRKYAQFWFDGTRLPFYVDLFLQPDPATWGYNFLVRTGSLDFSRRFVTPRSMGGCKPDDLTIKDARVWRNGAALPTPEEQDMFDLFEVKWIEPEDRQ